MSTHDIARALAATDKEALIAALRMFRFRYHFLPFVIALGCRLRRGVAEFAREALAVKTLRFSHREFSFKPHHARTIRVRQRIRTGRVGSL